MKCSCGPHSTDLARSSALGIRAPLRFQRTGDEPTNASSIRRVGSAASINSTEAHEHSDDGESAGDLVAAALSGTGGELANADKEQDTHGSSSQLSRLHWIKR